MFLAFTIGFIVAIISITIILIRALKGKKIGFLFPIIFILGTFIFVGAIGYFSSGQDEKVASSTTQTTQKQVQAQNQNQQKTQEQTKQQVQPVKSEQKTSKAPATQTYKILNNVQELQSRFNAQSDKYKLGFKISSTNIVTGQVQDVFQCSFTNYLGISCSINKNDNSIRELMMIAAGGDGSPTAGANIMITIGTLINTVDPSLTINDISQIISDLGLTQKDLIGLNKSITKDGFKYNIMISKETGVNFIISNANDK